MTEFDRLAAHLKNLQAKRVKQATFDVDWLIQALNIAPPIMPVSTPTATDNKAVNVDGGAFSDEKDR